MRDLPAGLLLSAALWASSVCGQTRDGPQPTPEQAHDEAAIDRARSGTTLDEPSRADATATITTLEDALKRAYRTNPTLLAQRAQLRSSDYRLPQARAGYGPRLTASGGYAYERDRFELSTGGHSEAGAWTTTAEAVISQPLYTFGRNAAAERGAAAEISFGRSTLRATEAQVLLATITAYSEVTRDEAGVGIARDNLALLEREYDDTAARLRAREATSTDFQQVEARIALGRAELYSAQEQMASSRAEFLRVVGGLPGELAPAGPLRLPIATLEEAYSFAERNNPVLAAAYAREKASRAALDAARAEKMPRIDLRGRAGTGPLEPYSNSVRQTSLRGEVIVSVPLFESGLLRARAGEAREANDSDWRLIDAALRDIRSEIAAAWNAVVAQRASVGQLRIAVDSAQSAYDGAVLQERAGMRTTLDVLDLARDLQTMHTRLNNAISGSYVAAARLLSAMGTLEASYLLPDEPPYDPEAHYAEVRHRGDVPLLTPLIRTIEGSRRASLPAARPVRDPAGIVAAPGVPVEPGLPESKRLPDGPKTTSSER